MKENPTEFACRLEIYNTLVGMSDGNWKEYNYAIGEVVHTYTLLEVFRNWEFLTNNSINKIKIFQEKWYRYIKDNAFGEDGLFVYFDNNWTNIVNEYLKPTIKSIEEDLATHGLRPPPIQKKQYIDMRPSDKDILDRGRELYTLLLKHKIVDKSYLD